MRFSANISTMYKEVPFLERFRLAAEAGFRAVEFWWPTDDLSDVRTAVDETGLEVALFNFDGGDMPAGERGLLSNPDTIDRFKENVPVALDVAAHFRCRKLNLLVGMALPHTSRDEQLQLAWENVRWAADQSADANVLILIEALNTLELPGYLLDNTLDAVAFIESVDRPNVRLQYDVYHMQRMEGNLAANLRKYFPRIGHIQIADSPDRGQPGTGEINYRYILQLIDDLGYDGYIGLEYLPPTASTEASLDWLPRELRGSNVQASSLQL